MLCPSVWTCEHLTVSLGQSLHHFDGQRGAEGLDVVVDGLRGRVALDPGRGGPGGQYLFINNYVLYKGHEQWRS